MDCVVVLMSAYNGQEFIREQLDSIFLQKDVDVKLVVRDDGSTDGTVAIIEEYILKYGDKIELLRGENLGWRKSFFTLIKYAAENYSNYEYFAFSDQDDIWLENKLDRATNCLKTLKEGPRLYCSNLIYYKDGTNFGLVRKAPVKPTYKNCLVRNYATGCTIVFNKSLLTLVGKAIPRIVVAHDYWTYQVAVLCGDVFADNESFILYRQHENNQIGIKTGFLQIWQRRIETAASNYRKRERQTKELYNFYRDNFSREGLNAVEKFIAYRSNLKNRFRLLLDNGYTLGRRSNDFWFKLRILFGIA